MNHLQKISGYLLICTFILFVMNSANARFPEFVYHKIGDTDEDLLGQSSLADLDDDGDMDLIVGSSGGSVWWFEYESAGKWIKHKLGEDALTDKGGVAFDVDGDGLTDQVSGGTWYKNNGNGQFTRFENGVIYSYDNTFADINKDGNPDLVALSEQEGLYWYDASSRPEKKWKKIKIDEGVPGGIIPKGVADINNDGHQDIIRSNIWYENVNGDGNKWIPHRTLSFVESTGKFANSSRVFAVDMDNDDDVDVVQSDANTENGKIAWHENKDGLGINWYTHPVASETKQDMHSLCVADFDNDGDYDIFSGGGPRTGELYKRCFIYENAEGNGEKWLKHEILFKKESFDAVSADVDGDGDIDICSKPWKGTEVYYLENKLINK